VESTGNEFTIAYGPPDIVERYTLYPETVDELAVQFSNTECPVGCAPDPDREIVNGEEAASLATVALPNMLPAAAGANVTFKVAVCPGVNISPDEIPPAVNPAPETLRLEIVTVEFPALVKVTPCTLLPPVFTWPNGIVVRLAVRMNVAGTKVSVAALLVVLPALFVSTTVNCAPLSEAVVAGVEYIGEVAPLIATPFLFHW
jgi:hypothetical protein